MRLQDSSSYGWICSRCERSNSPGLLFCQCVAKQENPKNAYCDGSIPQPGDKVVMVGTDPHCALGKMLPMEHIAKFHPMGAKDFILVERSGQCVACTTYQPFFEKRPHTFLATCQFGKNLWNKDGSPKHDK
jgi:hypothetical protein